MRIDRRLNLVVPIYEDEANTSPILAYVHSTPLSEAVVDRYFMVLGKTYNSIWTEGLGFAAGPGHAARVLRYIADREGAWEDRKGADGQMIPGVERGLMAEIRRLTNVLTLGPDGGWQPLPWDVAIQQGLISDEDSREVENAIVFFIAGYATLNRNQRSAVLERGADLWSAQLTSLTPTDFGRSLKTSIETDSSGAKPPAAAKEKSTPAIAAAHPKQSSVPT